MQYPLEERIGHPNLFIGRQAEMAHFQKWLEGIPNRLSKSRAILARKKSGKTAFVQRIFNQLWSDNGLIIPFYFEFAERNIWYADFAVLYYRHFASQYISFLERDPKLLKKALSLPEIQAYGKSHDIELFVREVEELEIYEKNGNYDQMWDLASQAPHRFADFYGKRALVIIDEFQNISRHIFVDQNKTIRDESMPGTYHEYSESKIAPMLVTGSYVGWLIRMISEYLEAGRLKYFTLSPYLAENEGLEAVYKYADFYDTPVTNETALLINQLCFSDPFFISSVVQSFHETKDLTTPEGVAATVHYELSNRKSEMSITWGEYINKSVDRINSKNTKNMLLHLCKYPERDWRHRELKEALNLDLDLNEILRQLRVLVNADLIEEGRSDIAFRGLKDGTLYRILRNRFEGEILDFEPDLEKEFLEEIRALQQKHRSLQGRFNQLSGRVAEYMLATDFRNRAFFAPSVYFQGFEKIAAQKWMDIRSNWKFQREDGKEMELDVVAHSEDKISLLVEVKKTQVAVNLSVVETFLAKTQIYAEQHPEATVIGAILGLGGFTKDAQAACKKEGLGTAKTINYLRTEWSD